MTFNGTVQTDSKLNSSSFITKFYRVCGCLTFHPSYGCICSTAVSLEGWRSSPGESSEVLMSYITSRHCTSSDVAPAQDFGGLKSNPEMEADLQVKTVWNAYLMAFFSRKKEMSAACSANWQIVCSFCVRAKVATRIIFTIN